DGAAPAAAEAARLRAAIAQGREQVERARDRVRERSHPAELLQVIEGHLMLLQDESFERAVLRTVEEERVNAEWAVRRVAEEVREALAASGDDVFRARGDDVSFVAERLVRNLAGMQAEALADLPPGVVIVARELSPVEMGVLAGRRVAAVVTEAGSRASHTAILARALGLPAVVGVQDLLGHVAAGATVAVDGSSGEVVVEPEASELPALRERARRLGDLERSLTVERDRPAETRDGRRVTLLANLEFPSEVETALGCGAEGVGLYRTEFLYVGRSRPPSEEEQVHIYSHVAGLMAPRPVTLRTFDLGGDKFVTRPVVAGELNPALGLRALRLGLHERDVFRTQLRAMLRAGAAGEISIMFPMVCGVGDFRQALEVVREAADDLRADGVTAGRDVPIGCMIEVPSAVVVADLLARDAAFFSIGTNDLVQYALAIDRANERVAHLYQPFHPAMLRLIRQAVDAGRGAGIPVAMCGAMAEDPLALPLLVGLGLERLSIAPSAVPLVKAVVRALRMEDARRVALAALDLGTAEEVAAAAEEFAGASFPELLDGRGCDC
ncbi:MAG: phosphoenolpyruvate--protein phosphotransferase, partial [Deltaproteobacteria bacterium]|nr:phosphoenolpyruvate--protein phosphotransferase [Deltaproteobacteria bacterium]